MLVAPYHGRAPADGAERPKEGGTLTDPLTDRERELRRHADNVESEADGLALDRALLAIKATLGGERAAEELAALDERVSDLTDEALLLEAQAAKERSDAELRLPENERNEVRGEQGPERRILEITGTRRQLMIDGGAQGVAPGSGDMLKIALRVEEQMGRRFGEEAQWRMPADDAEFGLEWRDGALQAQRPPGDPEAPTSP
jgi:hypothetical protein